MSLIGTNYPSTNLKGTSLRTISLDLRPYQTIRGFRFWGASPVNDSQTRISHTTDSRSRVAFERIASSIRRQAAKCKPRGQIGWLFARHYQVYQMLMRGEARYICLQSFAQPLQFLTRPYLSSQISTTQFGVAWPILLLIRRYHSIRSTVSISVQNIVWHTSKMNLGLI